MAFAIADRVRELVASFGGGAGPFTLPGVAAPGAHQTFLAGWGASGTGWCCITNGAAGQWVTGLGTLNAAGTTLTLTTPYHGSSGVGNAVAFPPGAALDCFGDLPAAKYGEFPGPVICSALTGALNVGGTGQGTNSKANFRFDPSGQSGIEISASTAGTAGQIFNILNNANTTIGSWSYGTGQGRITVGGGWNYSDLVMSKLAVTGATGHFVGGASGYPYVGLYQNGTVNAISARACAQQIDTVLWASADNDILEGLRVSPAWQKGAFTGISARSIVIAGNPDYAFYSGGAGKVFINDTTGTASSSTGALVVTGGVGIGAGLNVGGSVGINGNLTFTGPVNISTSANYLALTAASHLYLRSSTGNIYIGDDRVQAVSIGYQTSPIALNGNVQVNGTITIPTTNPQIVLNKVSNGANGIFAQNNGQTRWLITLGDQTLETGGNVGSKFILYGADDDGSTYWQAIGIDRSTRKIDLLQNTGITGTLTVSGTATMGNALITGSSLRSSGALAFDTLSSYIHIMPAAELYLRAGTTGNAINIADDKASPLNIGTGGGIVTMGASGVPGQFVYLNAGGGLYVGGASGGNKGYGTINAQALYDDNVLLTCFGVQHLKYGLVDLAQWDAINPNGRHELAHRFADMLGDFDPRDPDQYIAKMLRDEALPGMPAISEWKHNELSLGEMHNRLWLAVELLASAFVGAQNKLN